MSAEGKHRLPERQRGRASGTQLFVTSLSPRASCEGGRGGGGEGGSGACKNSTVGAIAKKPATVTPTLHPVGGALVRHGLPANRGRLIPDYSAGGSSAKRRRRGQREQRTRTVPTKHKRRNHRETSSRQTCHLLRLIITARHAVYPTTVVREL